ncbi:MAG: chemotaxis protein CheX [Oligoflexia bacterium]|nr:chemotaxis protein CheX [Oligoflexia bacterium]
MEYHLIEKKFEIWIKQRYVLIQIIDMSDSDTVGILKDKMIFLAQMPAHVIINFAFLMEGHVINDAWLPFLETVKNNLSSVQKKVILLYPPHSLVSKIRVYEGTSDYEVVPSLLFALENLSFEDKTDIPSGAKFLRAFVMSAIKTMFIQGKTFSKRGSLLTKKSNLNLLDGDLSGIINIESQQGAYAIFLSFPKSTFLRLMSQMLGEEISALTEDLEDGVSEVLNIVYGQAKAVLNKDDNTALRSEIPALIKGNIFPGNNSAQIEKVTKITSDLNQGYCVIVPFSSNLGEYYIRFWFKELDGARRLISSQKKEPLKRV